MATTTTTREQLIDTVKYATTNGAKELAESALRRLAKLDARENNASLMSCPRGCGVDIRHHHSTDFVNGGCDTGPMSAADMHDWFAARGIGQPGFLAMADAIAEHYGKTEDALNEMYDATHGPIA